MFLWCNIDIDCHYIGIFWNIDGISTLFWEYQYRQNIDEKNLKISILILISILIRTFWVKNPFFSAKSRAFSCFYDEISISIVDISAFFEISMEYWHFFWEYQYRQNIDKKNLNISISMKISIRDFWKYRYRYRYR